jgi:hypothetical protein
MRVTESVQEKIEVDNSEIDQSKQLAWKAADCNRASLNLRDSCPVPVCLSSC